MQVKDIMTRDVVTLRPEETLVQAAAVLYRHGIDGAPVVNESGQLIGLFSRSHIMAALVANKYDNTLVGQVMTTQVQTVAASVSLESFTQDGKAVLYGRLPVLDEQGRLVGILTRTDLVRHLFEYYGLLTEELQSILDSVYNGVIATDSDGVVTIFNPAAAHITGLSEQDVLGRPAAQVIPNSQLQRVLVTGQPEVHQKQIIGKSQIITNRTPILRNGRVVGSVAIFQDITEMEKTAAELEMVKNLKSVLESILESLYECIVVVDREGRITMLNQAYADFLGVDRAAAIGQHVTKVIDNTRMHIVAQTGKAEIGEIQRLGTKNVVVTRYPIVKDGEVIGAVGKMMFGDVRDLRRYMSKLYSLQMQLEYYKEELAKAHGGEYTFDSICGVSEKMRWLKTIAQKAAKGNSTVLITGESGTGKELFVHAIHYASPRRYGPFIRINCAAIPENLLESELFGYDEGAFTGAKKGGKPGKFELAQGGTIFLDEIGDMPLAMQAKLLRVLQEREADRVGGTKTYRVDVRVIAATNQNLEKLIEQGKFRQDLYYRLNIISLPIPPLRERREDIPVLAQTLLQKIISQVPSPVEGISPAAMALLQQYSWPGNVRELENVLERAVNIIDNDREILPGHLPPALRKKNGASENAGEDKENNQEKKKLEGIIAQAEKDAICRALAMAGGNKSRAAQLLGIHRSGFYQKLHKYHLLPE